MLFFAWSLMLTYDISLDSPHTQCSRDCHDDFRLIFVWNHERRSHPYSTYKVFACTCIHGRELDMSKGCADVTEEDEQLRPTCIYAFLDRRQRRKPRPSRDKQLSMKRCSQSHTDQSHPEGWKDNLPCRRVPTIKIIMYASSRHLERLLILGLTLSCEVRSYVP